MDSGAKLLHSAAKPARLPMPMPMPGSPGCARFQRTTSGCSTEVPEEHDTHEDGQAFTLDHSPSNSEDEEAGMYSLIGMQHLASEVGRWVESDIKAEDWLEREWCRKQGAAGARKEYMVDNRGLQADTVGLAYRRSKTLSDCDFAIPGCAWGSTVAGVADDEGWVRVGEHYLPMQLGGVVVLTQRTEAMRDGPALTTDGHALDLDSGSAIFFSHDRALSAGNEAKWSRKDEARMARAVKLAHTACEAEARLEAGEACAINPAGIVVGSLAPASKGGGDRMASRLKRFHRLRRLRERSAQKCGAGPDSVLCVGGDGRALVESGEACAIDPAGMVMGSLAPTSKGGGDRMASRLKRFHRLRRLRERSAQKCGGGPDSVLCVGGDGRVLVESGEACAIDPAGMVVGSLAPASKGGGDRMASRLKRFHRLRRLRERSAQKCGGGPDSVLCVGGDGRVFLVMAVEAVFEGTERRRLKRSSLRSRLQATAEEAMETEVLAVDINGVIRV